MIIFKAFDITEADKLNETISKTPISSKLNIFMANGKLLIPLEDGAPDTEEVKNIRIKEIIAQLLRDRDIIEISQKVIETEVEGATKKLKETEDKITIAGGTKESYDENKKLESEIKQLKNFIESKNQQHFTNQAEITRLTTNIDVHESILNKTYVS